MADGDAPKKGIIGPSLSALLNGIGIAGKMIVAQAMLAGSQDPKVVARVAQEMCFQEGVQWPPVQAADKAIWERRAASAILGLRFFIQDK